MIFNKFDPNQDVVSGRVTRIASGFWPNGLMTQSQSLFVDNFWSLTGSIGTPSYGTSLYDIRNTMYYLNVYPDAFHFQNNDPYFSIAYGNFAGNVGSGSFTLDSSSIQAFPTKAVYTQYANVLLESSTLDTTFTMQSGSTTVSANDIWVISFSAFKMKDNVDAGLLQFSLSGSSGSFTFIDDSPYITQTQNSYQIISGSLSNLPGTPVYSGLGVFYPSDGIIVLNAALVAQLVGISPTIGISPGTNGPGPNGSWIYNPGIETTSSYTYNHKTLATALELASNSIMNVRKSEYVPSITYFVRVFNRNFNYSNNPTYVYDGTDGLHAKGTIRIADFVNNPKTYITSIGLYDDNNNLVAVAKLSRPAVKSFDSELLIKTRLDF